LKRKHPTASKGSTYRLTCKVCGEGFDYKVVSAGFLAKTCSQACRRELQRGRKPDRWVTVICENPACGKSFTIRRSVSRRYCGRACLHEHYKLPPEARAKQSAAMRKRSGKANPNWRHGKRSGDRDRGGERRWFTALGEACEMCGGPGGGQGLVLHHVIYRQHVRGAHGDVWDPRNAMTLCGPCHSSHHHRGRIIPASMVPVAARTFAVETLGEGPTANYFGRYYGPG